MTLLSRNRSFLNLFPVPEFLLLSTAGIRVAETDTKFVQIRREILGDGFKLIRSMKSYHPPETMESGLIMNQEKLVPILNRFVSLYSIHYAHVMLPEEKAYIFTTQIDQVPREGLRDAVAFIIESNAPVSLSESVFDFEVIGETENSGKMKIAVCVLPEKVVSSYFDLFQLADIIPISFDTESQAVARAVIHQGDRRSHLIINLSLNKTGFYIVEDEVVQFSTTFNFGLGVEEPNLNLNDLRAEMRKVIAFWDTRVDNSGGKIEKIILCGPGANNKDFVSNLVSESGIPSVLADVWINMSPSRSHVPEISFDESLDYAAAIGLVLPHSGQ